VGDVSISTVKRSIRRLVEIGWFSRTRRYNTSNVYKWMGGGNLLRVHKEMKAYKKADDETEASHPNGSAATPPRVRAEPYEGSAVPPPPVRDDPLTPLRTPEGTPEGTRYDASAVADAPTTRVRDTTAADEWLRRRHGKSR
jgi:hypothetical protein